MNLKINELKEKNIFTLDMYLDYMCGKNSLNTGLVPGSKDFTVDIGDNKYRIMPAGEGEFSSTFYRGQNEYHSPCKPSLYRGGLKPEYLIKKYELEKILKENLIEELTNHYISINNQYQFSIEYEGLCQHYELPTSLLDITKNKDIAKFFAMCEFNNNEYQPRKGGSGIIYTVDLSKLKKEDRHKICLIGNQPIPRPKEQSGIAIRMNKDEDFNDLNFVEYECFDFTEKEAKEIFMKFNGGEYIFPNNIICKLLLKKLEATSIDSLYKYSNLEGINFYIIFKYFIENGFTISNSLYTNRLNNRKDNRLCLEISKYIKGNMQDFSIRGWAEHYQG